MAQAIHKIILLIYYIITANIMVCNSDHTNQWKPVEATTSH